MCELSIGNDIVDLNYDEPPLHPEFKRRVLTSNEQVQTDNDTKLWAYWSAKEAAYKTLKRLKPDLVFSPIKFECNNQFKEITYSDTKIACRCVILPRYCYTVCATSPNLLNSCKLFNCVEEIDSYHGANSTSACISTTTRRFAIFKISSKLNIPQEQVTISNEVKNGSRENKIPIVLINGNVSNILLSLTHHGRFIACTFFING